MNLKKYICRLKNEHKKSEPGKYEINGYLYNYKCTRCGAGLGFGMPRKLLDYVMNTVLGAGIAEKKGGVSKVYFAELSDIDTIKDGVPILHSDDKWHAIDVLQNQNIFATPHFKGLSPEAFQMQFNKAIEEENYEVAGEILKTARERGITLKTE